MGISAGSGIKPDLKLLLDRAPEGRLIELYFSVVPRKVLTPNDFADLAEVAA